MTPLYDAIATMDYKLLLILAIFGGLLFIFAPKPGTRYRVAVNDGQFRGYRGGNRMGDPSAQTKEGPPPGLFTRLWRILTKSITLAMLLVGFLGGIIQLGIFVGMLPATLGP